MSKKSVLSLDQRRARGAIFFDDDKGMTEQSHRDSCDINVIMKQYDKTGLVPVYSNMIPRYEDFSKVTDYQSACNLVIEAEESFNSLPAHVRTAYDNDPAKFLAAFEDPAERAKLIELGVISDEKGSSEGSEKKEAGEASKTSEGGQAA